VSSLHWAAQLNLIATLSSISGQSINIEDVQDHVLAGHGTKAASTIPLESNANSVTEMAAEEPRVLSFAELKELIEQGKTDQIPNNRIIPDELSVCNVSPSRSFSFDMLYYRKRLLACLSLLSGRNLGRPKSASTSYKLFQEYQSLCPVPTNNPFVLSLAPDDPSYSLQCSFTIGTQV
jgi:hypothetical protein